MKRILEDIHSSASGLKIQALGRKLVLQLHMVLRTIRIHDPSNKALLIAVGNLCDTINTLWAALGEIRIEVVRDQVYVNDVRIRADVHLAAVTASIHKELDAKGMGGLSFTRPVNTEVIRDFLLLLSRPAATAEEVHAIRVSLQQIANLAIELLGPRTYEEDAPEDIRVDRKTVALQTYAKAVVCAREYAASIEAGEIAPAAKIRITRVIQDLIDVAHDRLNFLLKICAIKTGQDYPFKHAANTCVLALALGRALCISRVRLVDLGLSAFLSDLGLASLPPEAAQAAEVPGADDRAVRVARARAFRAVLGKGKLAASSFHQAIVAHEHGLPYLDTSAYARIVAVAASYDALTTKRPWREAYPPDEALRILWHAAGSRYDPTVVKAFVNLLGVYPLGTAVYVDSGELAVVYHTGGDPRLFDRPWVKVVRDTAGHLLERTVVRNLAAHQGPGGRIVRVATEQELSGVDFALAALS